MPAFGKLKQEDGECQTSLDYIVRHFITQSLSPSNTVKLVMDIQGTVACWCSYTVRWTNRIGKPESDVTIGRVYGTIKNCFRSVIQMDS